MTNTFGKANPFQALTNSSFDANRTFEGDIITAELCPPSTWKHTNEKGKEIEDDDKEIEESESIETEGESNPEKKKQQNQNLPKRRCVSSVTSG